MLKEVIIPKLGLTMETGIIEKWYKKEGEFVQKGEALFEVTTDKATMEVESAESGYIKKILMGEGEEAPVSSIIAYIGDKDEEIAIDEDQTKPIVQKVNLSPEIQPQRLRGTNIPKHEAKSDEEAPYPILGKQDKIVASPLAKKLASELSVDISKIKSSGPDDRIVKEDVLAAKEAMSLTTAPTKDIQTAEPSTPIAFPTEPQQKIAKAEQVKSDQVSPAFSELRLMGIKKIVAERMKTSYLDAPHIYLELICDMSDVEHLRGKANNTYKDRAHITYTDIIIMAASKALKSNPLLNATLKGDSILIYEDINIGVATSTNNGLLVPVIKSADRLSLLEISIKRQELVQRAREGKQTLNDLVDGTFTVSNLGMFHIESFRPILTPGQVAILAAGEVKVTPVVSKSGEIIAKPLMSLSLACDHRIADGADGAKFLSDLEEMLENSATML